MYNDIYKAVRKYAKMMQELAIARKNTAELRQCLAHLNQSVAPTMHALKAHAAANGMQGF
jgi:hypothetical protein